MKPVFRLDDPTDDDVSTFHRDGFLILPEVFTDEGLKGLTEEILSLQEVKDYFKSLSKSNPEADNLPPKHPSSYFVRPWNDRGPWGDRLIDAPLVPA